MTSIKVGRLSRLDLNVADLDRSCAFYIEALGFETASLEAGDRALLRLGSEEIGLIQAPADAAPYPAPRAANDPWFQHFAVAVADLDAAYTQIRPHVEQSISWDGPVVLPPSTGSVGAYKFCDPDGHALELSFAPASTWATTNRGGGRLFQGIDHTALAVADLEASLVFYEGLGFRPGPRLLNRGPEQDRLDGLANVALDIAILVTPEPGPHFELLHYRRPRGRPARQFGPSDLPATETILTSSEGPGADMICDPDGHRLNVS